VIGSPRDVVSLFLNVSLFVNRVTNDESRRVQSFSRVKHHVFSSNFPGHLQYLQPNNGGSFFKTDVFQDPTGVLGHWTQFFFSIDLRKDIIRTGHRREHTKEHTFSSSSRWRRFRALHSGVRQKGKNWDRVTRQVDERAPTAVGGWSWRVQKVKELDDFLRNL
jgi:hypothetical protein